MELHKVHIKGYKNLSNFYIEFSPNNPDITTVLIGQNASGKSNFLEAIVCIFDGLFWHTKITFFYDITYECRGKIIQIINEPTSKTLYFVDGIGTTAAHFEKCSGKGRLKEIEPKEGQFFDIEEIPNYLPDHIFAYYSGLGNNKRLEKLFTKFQNDFLKELLNNKKEATLPFLFFAKLVHSYFALLSFFAYPNDKDSKFLKETIQIESFDSILFVVREKLRGKFPEKEDSNPKFWNARGVVADFLEHLWDDSFALLRKEIKISLTDFNSTNKEAVYIFIPTQEDLIKLAKPYEGKDEFFKYLNSLYMSDLLEEIQIRVGKKGIDEKLTFQDLSEGEQQLLVVLGLLRFFGEKECLFLLDEPDTHLNPRWQYHYMRFLKQVAGLAEQEQKSQVIITTHQGLVVNGLKKESIRRLRFNNQDQIVADMPDKDFIGTDIDDILTDEELFGLDTTLDIHTTLKIKQRRKLYNQLDKPNLSEQERTKLQQELKTIDNELKKYHL